MGIFDFIKKKEPEKKAEQSKALKLSQRAVPKSKDGSDKVPTNSSIPRTPAPERPAAKSSSVVAPIHPIKQSKTNGPRINKAPVLEEAEPVIEAQDLKLSKQGPTEAVNLEKIPKAARISFDDIEREKLNLKSQTLSQQETEPVILPETEETKELKIKSSSQDKETEPESKFSMPLETNKKIKFANDHIVIPFPKVIGDQSSLIKQDQLLNSSSMSISVGKSLTMKLLGEGKFELSIDEIINLASENPFLDEVDKTQTLAVDLTEIMPCVPAHWFSLSEEQDSKAMDSLSDIDCPFNFEDSEEEASPQIKTEEKSKSSLFSQDLKEEGEDEVALDETIPPVMTFEDEDEEDNTELAIEVEEDDDEDTVDIQNEIPQTPELNLSPKSSINSRASLKVPTKEATNLFNDTLDDLKKPSANLFMTEDGLQKDDIQVKAPEEEIQLTLPDEEELSLNVPEEEEKLELSVIAEEEELSLNVPEEEEKLELNVIADEEENAEESLELELSQFLEDIAKSGYPEIQSLHINQKLKLSKSQILPGLSQGKVELSASQLFAQIIPPIDLAAKAESPNIELPLVKLIALIPPAWMQLDAQDDSHLASINEIDDPFSNNEQGQLTENISELEPENKKSSSKSGLSLLNGDLEETSESRPVSPSKDDLIREELNKNLDKDSLSLEFAENTPNTFSTEESLSSQLEKEPAKKSLFAEPEIKTEPAVINELSDTIDSALFAEATPSKIEEAPKDSGLILESPEAVEDLTLAEPESSKALSQSGLILEEETKLVETSQATRKERTSSFLKSDKAERPSSAPNGVDLNRCSADEILDIFEDLNPSLADAIVALRSQKQGFSELREILEIEQISAQDFKALTGMSPSDSLVESERRINRIIKLDRKKDYSLSQIIDTAQEELDFKSIVLSGKDGLQICAAGDSDLFDTTSELLASISPQLFKKTKQFLEQSMLPQPDLFTFYTQDNPVTFAPCGEIALVFIHDSPWPTPNQMAKTRNLVAELSWYCSRRLVL